MPPHDPTCGKRQRMASRFVAQPKLLASGAPFPAVRGDPAASRARKGKQMRDLMLQCAQEFFFAKFTQTRIEIDHGVGHTRCPRRTPHPRIPADTDGLRHRSAPRIGEPVTRDFSERGVVTHCRCFTPFLTGFTRQRFGAQRASGNESRKKIELH